MCCQDCRSKDHEIKYAAAFPPFVPSPPFPFFRLRPRHPTPCGAREEHHDKRGHIGLGRFSPTHIAGLQDVAQTKTTYGIKTCLRLYEHPLQPIGHTAQNKRIHAATVRDNNTLIYERCATRPADKENLCPRHTRSPPSTTHLHRLQMIKIYIGQNSWSLRSQICPFHHPQAQRATPPPSPFP